MLRGIHEGCAYGTESADFSYWEVNHGGRQGSIWRYHEASRASKEDIYFAEHDRELIEKLKAQLQKTDKQESRLHCPKCPGLLETYTFQGFVLDRCQNCGGIWMDKGELEGVIRKINRGP